MSSPAVAVAVADVIRAVDGRALGATGFAGRLVGGGYASDLLSDVMAHAADGDVWVTLQRHVNTVAVAQLKNVPAIVIVHGREPDADTVARAAEHGVVLIVTPLPAFEAVGRLYQLGLRGRGTS